MSELKEEAIDIKKEMKTEKEDGEERNEENGQKYIGIKRRNMSITKRNKDMKRMGIDLKINEENDERNNRIVELKEERRDIKK